MAAHSASRRAVHFTAVALAFALTWVAFTGLGRVTESSAQGLAAVYLPIAVAVAVMVRAPRHIVAVMVGIVLGSVALRFLAGDEILPGAPEGLANAVEAVTIAWILIRLRAQRFTRPIDALALAIAGVVGCAVGATLGTTAARLLGGAADFPDAWRIWFASDLVAVVLLVPFGVLIRRSSVIWRKWPALLGMLLLTTLLALSASASLHIDGQTTLFLLFLCWYLLLVLVLLIGVWFGVEGMGLAQLPAALAVFTALSASSAGFLLASQGVATIMGASLLAAVIAIRVEIHRRAASDVLARSMFDDTPVPSARLRAPAARPASPSAVDPDGRTPGLVILEANRAWCDLLRIPASTIAGTDLLRYVHPDDMPEVMATVTSGHHKSVTPGDIRLIRRGEDTPILVVLTAVAMLPVESMDEGIIVIAEDVTARREAEYEIRRQARTDDLTGIDNRRAIVTRVERRLAAKHELAVLFIDLNGFKAINDSFGHRVGDQVLQCVADRLSGAVRPGDAVGRYGGDEFIMIASFPAGGDLEALTSRVEAVLAVPMHIDGHELHVRGAIGTAVTAPGDDVEDLLNRADAAMYARKADGRDRPASTGLL